MSDEDKTAKRIGELMRLYERTSDEALKDIFYGHIDRIIKEWGSEPSTPLSSSNVEWGLFHPSDVLRDLGFTEQEIKGNQELAAKEVARLYREATGKDPVAIKTLKEERIVYPMEFWGEARSLLAGMFVSDDPGYLDF